MPVIAIAGQKGGSGKTTAALCVASELVARGHQVLLVDADPQGSARTWADVATENGHAAPTVVGMGAQMHQSGQLDALARGCDFTVIDCPPANGPTQRSALMVSDLAVLPCGPSPVDAWALAESVELVRAAQERRPVLRAFVLVTRVQRKTALGDGVRKVLKEAGLPLLRTQLGYRVAYQEAPAAGLGVAQYVGESHPAAREVRSLVTELLREVNRGTKTKLRA